jgi:hypothetical protein
LAEGETAAGSLFAFVFDSMEKNRCTTFCLHLSPNDISSSSFTK